jgi:hypothetical protein
MVSNVNSSSLIALAISSSNVLMLDPRLSKIFQIYFNGLEQEIRLIKFEHKIKEFGVFGGFHQLITFWQREVTKDLSHFGTLGQFFAEYIK